MDIPAMTAHVLELAKRHRVEIVWLPEWQYAECFPEARYALVPTITRPSDYLVALHELGHAASQIARRVHKSTAVYDVLVCEGAAWAWACEHADPEILGRMAEKDWQVLLKCWKSNLRWGLTRPTDYATKTA